MKCTSAENVDKISSMNTVEWAKVYAMAYMDEESIWRSVFQLYWTKKFDELFYYQERNKKYNLEIRIYELGI